MYWGRIYSSYDGYSVDYDVGYGGEYEVLYGGYGKDPYEGSIWKTRYVYVDSDECMMEEKREVMLKKNDEKAGGIAQDMFEIQKKQNYCSI